MALLWKFITDNESYEKIKEYAENNQLIDILDDFLAQLKEYNLINTDFNLPKNKVNYLKNHFNTYSTNFKYFTDSLTKFYKKNNLIENLFIVLSYKCNLNCKHCCNSKDINEYEINFDQAKKIIDDAYNIGVIHITLTGGECTLNKDFLKIAQYVRKKHLNLTIKTNGQKLYDDKNLLEEIIKLYPDNLQLSLYSADPFEHDNMTQNKGSFDKTLFVIKKLKENNIYVDISNFISSYNKYSNDGLIKMAKELQAGYRNSCFFINNPINNNSNALLNENELCEFYYKTIDFTKKYKKFEKNNENICGAARIYLSVEPDLSVTPCAYHKHILGNLKNTTLTEIHKNVLPEFRKTIYSNNLKECFKYDYCKYCYYCSLVASYDRGYMSKSEFLCIHARALQKAHLKYLNEQKNEKSK